MNLEVLIGLIGIGVATMAMIGGLLTFRELEDRNASPTTYESRVKEQHTTNDATTRARD